MPTMFAQYSKNAHVSKKAKNAHTSLSGSMLEDILGKTSLTIHDDTKLCTRSHGKRTFKRLPLGRLVGVLSTNQRYRPIEIEQRRARTFADVGPEQEKRDMV